MYAIYTVHTVGIKLICCVCVPLGTRWLIVYKIWYEHARTRNDAFTLMFHTVLVMFSCKKWIWRFGVLLSFSLCGAILHGENILNKRKLQQLKRIRNGKVCMYLYVHRKVSVDWVIFLFVFQEEVICQKWSKLWAKSRRLARWKWWTYRFCSETDETTDGLLIIYINHWKKSIGMSRVSFQFERLRLLSMSAVRCWSSINNKNNKNNSNSKKL